MSPAGCGDGDSDIAAGRGTAPCPGAWARLAGASPGASTSPLGGWEVGDRSQQGLGSENDPSTFRFAPLGSQDVGMQSPRKLLDLWEFWAASLRVLRGECGGRGGRRHGPVPSVLHPVGSHVKQSLGASRTSQVLPSLRDEELLRRHRHTGDPPVPADPEPLCTQIPQNSSPGSAGPCRGWDHLPGWISASRRAFFPLLDTLECPIFAS